ncbi:hypothetical protein ABZ401_13885 [Streptomyces sp. NPDC005892]|uniref:hypothetical protein n=1 Tax=Streptomyces sp. NPDC005892 TaxID=3155593 RepID=UPI0033C57301
MTARASRYRPSSAAFARSEGSSDAVSSDAVSSDEGSSDAVYDMISDTSRSCASSSSAGSRFAP